MQLNDATCARIRALLERLAETRAFWHDHELRESDRRAVDDSAISSEDGAPSPEASETYRKITAEAMMTKNGGGTNGKTHDDDELQ